MSDGDFKATEAAKRAYFYYCRRAQGRSDNYVCATWEELGAKKRNCWVAAALAVLHYVTEEGAS